MDYFEYRDTRQDRLERESGAIDRLESDMTICIAALCENGKTLVMAADRMRSWGNTHGEFDTHKILILRPGWRAMTAGHTGLILPAIEAAKRRIKKAEEAEIPNIVEEEYAAALRRKAKLFQLPGDSRFRLGARLIVCGFAKGRGTVWYINDKKGLCAAPLGFAAIGSGAAAVRSALIHCRYKIEMSLGEAMFRISEAKMAAERTTGVGDETELRVLRDDWKNARRLGETKKQILRTIIDERRRLNRKQRRRLADLQKSLT